MKDSKGKKVLVAMSGGVDSSVAAALLKEQGYDVIGCTMQVWDYSKNSESCKLEEQGNGTCCSSIDVEDARAVADHLDIPFYVLNCEQKFQEFVIDDFVDSYLEGRTPIPCVNCNTYLKFDHLIQKMKELDCDYLATGHYAQKGLNAKGSPTIITSSDSWKDQTYFLFTLNPELLEKIIFPVGHLEKPQLREYALEKKLPVAKKKDSTGLCFIGKQGYDQFLNTHVTKEQYKPGELIDITTQQVLGHHEGIHKFTYGQRKGLGISSDRPLYVVRIDSATHKVWLGEEKDLYSDQLKIQKSHWLDSFENGETLSVKIRYAHKGAKAQIYKKEDHYQIQFEEPQRSITPGQAAVVYRGKQLLGGGWIL